MSIYRHIYGGLLFCLDFVCFTGGDPILALAHVELTR